MDQYPKDEFTESDVTMCLDYAGLKWKSLSRYIVTQCPSHEDRNPSTQIFKDDWFVNCLAGCGRYHITKVFPQLRPGYKGEKKVGVNFRMGNQQKYQEYDVMEWWQGLPLIPRDHVFKKIPLEILDELGWRWHGDLNSYFIPYFDSTKQTIPFGQWRHLTGERRFTFLKDAKPTMYGTWCLEPNMRVFLVEGTSDCAVLNYAALPCVAAPSASAMVLVATMSSWCSKNAVELIYAGDNDDAGNKLREELDKHVHYRVCQPPKKYKDWGDFLEADGVEAVQDHALKVFGETKPVEDNSWWQTAKQQFMEEKNRLRGEANPAAEPMKLF